MGNQSAKELCKLLMSINNFNQLAYYTTKTPHSQEEFSLIAKYAHFVYA